VMQDIEGKRVRSRLSGREREHVVRLSRATTTSTSPPYRAEVLMAAPSRSQPVVV